MPSPGSGKVLGSQGRSQGRAQFQATAALAHSSQFPLQGVARAERAVPPGHAGGGSRTKKKRLFSNMEGFKNLFLSLFLESLRLGPKVPSCAALTPSTRRVQF